MLVVVSAACLCMRAAFLEALKACDAAMQWASATMLWASAAAVEFVSTVFLLFVYVCITGTGLYYGADAARPYAAAALDTIQRYQQRRQTVNAERRREAAALHAAKADIVARAGATARAAREARAAELRAAQRRTAEEAERLKKQQQAAAVAASAAAAAAKAASSLAAAAAAAAAAADAEAARGLTAAALAPGGAPCAVSAAYVERCTGGFKSRLLGEGGFGDVRLGVDKGLGLRFAVKRLADDVGGVPRAAHSAEKEIQARRPVPCVSSQGRCPHALSPCPPQVLGRFQHKHIIRLWGYTDDAGKAAGAPRLLRCLIYEYGEGGALSGALEDDARAAELTWQVWAQLNE